MLLLFLIIDFCLLISVVIAQIFTPTAELVMPIRIPTKESKAEIEAHPVTPEAENPELSSQYIVVGNCFNLLSSNQFGSFLQ